MQTHRRLPFLLISIAAVCAGLTACTHTDKPKYPNFVTYDSRQLAAINAGSQSNANSFADIKDRLTSMPEVQFAGADVTVSDTAVNTGAPASGIKVILRGSAFDDGILGAPTRAMISTSTVDDTPGPKGEFTLTQGDSGAYTGEVDLKCEKNVIVSILCPAKKGGTGDVQLSIAPKDKGGASSAVFAHTYTVRSETDDSQNSSE